MLHLLKVTILNIIVLFQESYSNVIVIDENKNLTVTVFTDASADFGPEIQQKGLLGHLTAAVPINACSAIKPPPTNFNASITTNWIALIKRHNCTFVEKVLNAQRAGYDAVIIYNFNYNILEPMHCAYNCDVKIPSVLVGHNDGYLLRVRYQYNMDSGYFIILTSDDIYNLNKYLLVFAVIVAICFLVMLVFVIIKYIKNQRLEQRYRMPSSCLKKIPQLKYKVDDPYEVCPVCLEEYTEGDKLRILPCSHGYHAKCIDPWLTKKRRVCPVCKRRIFASNEKPIDSDSDSFENEEFSENTPLLSANHQLYNSASINPVDCDGGFLFGSESSSVENNPHDTCESSTNSEQYMYNLKSTLSKSNSITL